MIWQSAMITLHASNGKIGGLFIFFTLWKIQQLNAKLKGKKKMGQEKKYPVTIYCELQQEYGHCRSL